MDKFVVGTLGRVGVGAAVLVSLVLALLTQDVYYESPTERYLDDGDASGCRWPPDPIRNVVPWFEDGRMSLIRGLPRRYGPGGQACCAPPR